MDYYSDNAGKLSESYDSLDPEVVHQSWEKQIEGRTGLALDVGAGSGRDARWLAEKAWDVIAVEPCNNLRELAKDKQPCKGSVTWIDDKLPELKQVRNLDYRFNLIIVSAVWMHILEKDRERSFRILTDLLTPSGILV
ncbi:MAG: class I SAM-dependent methyltransferase, partial [Gammaproteobacteria bacterium]|nr:class I SAM-dependent methyltransferase [Gammaproteobacteria bacterium]